ncbi:MAG: rRNA maturation RNase YbeY [Alphaproteobacteria bacterium]|nr:rRNA maturation RNase YbeY [Alphaproteobacteria bacterium]
MTDRIKIVIEDEAWTQIDGYNDWISRLDGLLQESINKECENDQRCWVGLLLTDNRHMQILNRNFREVNTPTNVLSFPEYDTTRLKNQFSLHHGSDIFLGDIAMSREQIVNESAKYGIKFFDRCSHLFVHGVLHLLGLDHVEEEARAEMERTEIKILNKFGVNNPYILKEEEK